MLFRSHTAGKTVKSMGWSILDAGFTPNLIRIARRFTNLGFIREALLDGELCKEGILNRTAVDLALTNDVTKSRALSGEILKHLDLELWIRRSRQAVARTQGL